MFRIGEFSKISKTTIKTLRYYDEIDLLKPENTDSFTGYRFYTTNQLIKLHKIQGLRQIGLSINEIKTIMSGHNCQKILENRKSEILSEIASANDQLSRIEFILNGKQEEKIMNYIATIKEIPECIVYSKKVRISGYEQYFEIIPAIGQQVMTKYPDLKCASPEYCFVTYLDNEFKEKDFNIEWCEAVKNAKPDFDDIVFKTLPKTTVVSVFHKGSYSSLPQAYAYAIKWIEENGYTISDSARESYIDGIWNKSSEDEWLTEIQFPIHKK